MSDVLQLSGGKIATGDEVATAPAPQSNDEGSGPARNHDGSLSTGHDRVSEPAEETYAKQVPQVDADPVDSSAAELSKQVFPPPNALWTAGSEETVAGEWGHGGGFLNSGDNSYGASSTYARSDERSLRMTIDTSQGTAAVRAFRWAETKKYGDLYFSAWYYIPRRVDPEHFWNLFQFKSKVVDGQNMQIANDPIWAIRVANRDNGEMYAQLHYRGSYLGGSDRYFEQAVTSVPVGKWFNLEAHLVQSTGSRADGRVTLWQDGKLLFDKQGVRTRHAVSEFRNAQAVWQHWSVNNYSNGLEPDVVTLFVDDVAISRTRIWAP